MVLDDDLLIKEQLFYYNDLKQVRLFILFFSLRGTVLCGYQDKNSREQQGR